MLGQSVTITAVPTLAVNRVMLVLKKLRTDLKDLATLEYETVPLYRQNVPIISSVIWKVKRICSPLFF
jgi:hypothetical protein